MMGSHRHYPELGELLLTLDLYLACLAARSSEAD